MKKKVVLFLLIMLSSCSSNECLTQYFKEELKENKGAKSTLIDKKVDVGKIFKVYVGKKRGMLNTQAKSFNQADYNFLIYKYGKDTLTSSFKKESDYMLLKRAKKNGDDYDDKEYRKLSKEYKKMFEYWSKKESQKIGFDKILKTNLDSYIEDTIPLTDEFSYNISKPLFSKNKKTVMFAVLKIKNQNLVVDDYVIIMEKRKHKWMLKEKVLSSTLH